MSDIDTEQRSKAEAWAENMLKSTSQEFESFRWNMLKGNHVFSRRVEIGDRVLLTLSAVDRSVCVFWLAVFCLKMLTVADSQQDPKVGDWGSCNHGAAGLAEIAIDSGISLRRAASRLHTENRDGFREGKCNGRILETAGWRHRSGHHGSSH